MLKIPVNLLPQTVQFLTQLGVSLARMRDLFLAEERGENALAAAYAAAERCAVFFQW